MAGSHPADRLVGGTGIADLAPRDGTADRDGTGGGEEDIDFVLGEVGR